MFQHLNMLFQILDTLFHKLNRLFQILNILFRNLNILSQDLNILFQNLNIPFRIMNILFPRVNVDCLSGSMGPPPASPPPHPGGNSGGFPPPMNYRQTVRFRRLRLVVDVCFCPPRSDAKLASLTLQELTVMQFFLQTIDVEQA